MYVFRKYKTSGVLNIIGLSVALAVFIIAMIQVDYDLSFNQRFKHSRNIYQLSFLWKSKDVFNERENHISYPIARDMADKYPEIKSYCLWHEIPDYSSGSKKKKFMLSTEREAVSFEIYLMGTTHGFSDVFSPEIILGDINGAFTEPGKAMITEDIAHMVFGNENPIGKNLYPADDLQNPLTIVAVCKKFPDNVSLKNGIYSKLIIDEYRRNYTYKGYYILDKKEVLSLKEKLNAEFILGEEDIERFDFVPFTEVHFDKDMEGEGNLVATISILSIGILILIIAYINFMNFSLAMIPSRLTTINIKKISGADTWKLKIMMASEASFFCMFSFLFAMGLVYLFNRTNLSDFLVADLVLADNLGVLLFAFLIVTIFGFLLGLYPASTVSAYQPAMILNHSYIQSSRNVLIRDVLVTVQFFAAIVLIVFSIFIKMQYDYMMDYTWGLQKENILYFPLELDEASPATLFNELKENPEIMEYTIGYAVPGYVDMLWGRTIQDQRVEFNSWFVQANFLSFFGIDMIEGRDFTESDNGTNRLICNETFARTYNLEGGVVGKKIKGEDSEIIGVMKDVNFSSIHNEIKPLCVVSGDLLGGRIFFLKVTGNNMYQTINHIKNVWKNFSVKPLDIHFLEDTVHELYDCEKFLSQLILILGMIAVIIAIMGVYGLIMFNAKYKEKEIAIRKINGASVQEIIFLLNRSMMFQMIIAFILAVPIAYFIASGWLANFAYRIPVYWWVFAFAGILIVTFAFVTVTFQSYKAAVKNPADVLKNE